MSNDVRAALGLPPIDPSLTERFGPPLYTAEQAQSLLARAQAAEALLQEAAKVLEWMHRKGGLGYEVHDAIEGLIARLASSKMKQVVAPK